MLTTLKRYQLIECMNTATLSRIVTRARDNKDTETTVLFSNTLCTCHYKFASYIIDDKVYAAALTPLTTPPWWSL